MRIRHRSSGALSWGALGWCAILFAAACRSQQPPAPPAPDYRVTATVEEIMDAMVDPSADALWLAVSTTIDRTGVTDRQPRTDAEWQAVRRSAITLLEAADLLLVPGRRVAPPGATADDPRVEISPEEIAARIARDRANWARLAHGLQDAVLPALRAIDARDPQALEVAGEGIDLACQQCHEAYWYTALAP